MTEKLTQLEIYLQWSIKKKKKQLWTILIIMLITISLVPIVFVSTSRRNITRDKVGGGL